MPEAPAGVGLQGDERAGKEIHAMAVAAVEVGLGCLGGNVDDAAGFIEGLAGPGHDACGGLPGIGRQVSLPTSPGRGMRWKIQRRSPVRTSIARTAPGPPTPPEDEEVLVSNTRRIEADVGRALGVQSAAEGVKGAVLARDLINCPVSRSRAKR